MLPIRYFFVIALTISLGSVDYAQDNRGAGAAGATNARRDPDQEAKPDPFAQELLNLAARGNREMAEAISSLARTGRWAQANLLLERLSKQNLDAATLAAMQEEIEPAVFLELRLNDQLSDDAKSALDRLSAATKQYQQSPQRLRAAIKQLDDPSTDKRLGAARVLVAGGNAAIVELVAAAVAAQPPADRDAVLLRVASAWGRRY